MQSAWSRSVAVEAAPVRVSAVLTTRQVVAALVLLALAAVIGIGIYARASDIDLGTRAGSAGSHVSSAISNKINQGLNGIKSVADMLTGRSPGERATGALASLKHKRVAALHERALPKIRQAPPASPLASILAAPPVPPAIVPPVATPLYNAVTSPPAVSTPLAQAAPIIFPAMVPLPGGGGLIVPPVVTQVTPPVPAIVPTAPAVPEPASWMMMLVGFGLVGWTIRRSGKSARFTL